MVIDSTSLAEWNSQREAILDRMANLNLKENGGWMKNSDRIWSLLKTLNNMKTMESSKTIYSLNKVEGTGYLRYDPTTKNMVIDYSETANFVHEVTHGGQFESGEIGYYKDGSGAFANDIWDEVAAYKAQSAYDPQTTEGKNINNITPMFIRGIEDKNGLKIYAPGGSANIGGYSLNKNSGMYDTIRAYPHLQREIIQSFGTSGMYGAKLKDFPNLIFK